MMTFMNIRRRTILTERGELDRCTFWVRLFYTIKVTHGVSVLPLTFQKQEKWAAPIWCHKGHWYLQPGLWKHHHEGVCFVLANCLLVLSTLKTNGSSNQRKVVSRGLNRLLFWGRWRVGWNNNNNHYRHPIISDVFEASPAPTPDKAAAKTDESTCVALSRASSWSLTRALEHLIIHRKTKSNLTCLQRKHTCVVPEYV